MMKKRVVALALIAAWLLSSAALAADATPPDWLNTRPEDEAETGQDGPETEDTEETEKPEEPGETSGSILISGQHTAYISGSGGQFRPGGNLSRGEAAQMIYRLLPQKPEMVTVSFTDVAGDEWYAQAALALGSLGVVRPGQTEFLPNEELKRSEFIRYLAYFSAPRTDAQPFTDVPPDHPDAPYLLSARAWGWLSGFEDGTARPDAPITRAEAVAMVNRAVGRTPDKGYIDSVQPVFYLDVAPGSWYYYEVAEASVSHEHTGSGETEKWSGHTPVPSEIPDGYHLIDGWLYCFDSGRGGMVRNDTAGNWTFNAEGHFTSGSDDLDNRLRWIVMNVTNSGMTQEQKLRALYLYTRDNFTYRRRPAYAFGVLDFMQKDALDMLSTGYGNCYSYASVFWYLSRWIGYDAAIYSGTVGNNRAPHSWVEIGFDGRNYIFDTELEMAYRKKGRYDVNLYKYIDVDGWHYIR